MQKITEGEGERRDGGLEPLAGIFLRRPFIGEGPFNNASS